MSHLSCIWIAACCSTSSRINVDRSSPVVCGWRDTSFLRPWRWTWSHRNWHFRNSWVGVRFRLWFILTTWKNNRNSSIFYFLTENTSTIDTKEKLSMKVVSLAAQVKVEHRQRNIEVKTTANCNSLCQIYTSKYTNLLINFAANAELDFKLWMWFSEKSDVVVNQWVKLLAWHCPVVWCCSDASCSTKTFANTIHRQGLITLLGWQQHQNEVGCSFSQSFLSSPPLTYPTITVISITLPWRLWSRARI